MAVRSTRRLEQEAGRNLEVMWLLGRVPDHKTIADFRKDKGPAIREVCARFVQLCREMGLLDDARNSHHPRRASTWSQPGEDTSSALFAGPRPEADIETRLAKPYLLRRTIE